MKDKLSSNLKRAKLDDDIAQKTLENVFKACNQVPNALDFHSIVKKQRYEWWFFTLSIVGISTSAIFFVIFLLLPFLIN